MLRPPVEPMRARGVTGFPDPHLSRIVQAFEPKWDGWRALAFVGPSGVVLQSRAGKPLHPYFPDVCAQLRAFLPPGCVADGELVAWESGRERTSFPLLQRRVTAGRRLPQEMREHPAHLVLFDLLQDAGGVELLRLPLVARRARLAELLTGHNRSCRCVRRQVPRRELGSILPVAAWAGPYETHPWPQPLPAIWSGQFQQPQPFAYVPLEPVIVVEVSADVAVERGRWRHPVTMIRTRLDLDPSDVDAPSGRFA
jgi:hypothetical protein